MRRLSKHKSLRKLFFKLCSLSSVPSPLLFPQVFHLLLFYFFPFPHFIRLLPSHLSVVHTLGVKQSCCLHTPLGRAFLVIKEAAGSIPFINLQAKFQKGGTFLPQDPFSSKSLSWSGLLDPPKFTGLASVHLPAACGTAETEQGKCVSRVYPRERKAFQSTCEAAFLSLQSDVRKQYQVWRDISDHVYRAPGHVLF